MYETIFDIAEKGYAQWWSLGIAASLTIVSGALFFGQDSIRRFPYFWLPKRAAEFLNGMGFVFCCFGLIFTVVSTFYDYISARIALDRGHYSVVEGSITDFKPLPSIREGEQGVTGNESFVVQGKIFSYSDYDTRAGFNKTKRQGNQLDNGLKVRITYLNNKNDNEILRLEVAR